MFTLQNGCFIEENNLPHFTKITASLYVALGCSIRNTPPRLEQEQNRGRPSFPDIYAWVTVGLMEL